jgi:hypothetical protein
MLRGLSRVVGALFVSNDTSRLSKSPSRTGGVRMRRIVVVSLAALIVAGLVMGVYGRFFREPPPLAAAPEFKDTGDRLPTQQEFEELVRTDPVKMLDACLRRYHREVKNGITATLVKSERVYGDPKPPKEPQEEVVRLAVRGDVPDADGKGRVQVRMIWEFGARKSLLGTVNGTLFLEEEGGGKDKITVSTGIAVIPTAVNGPLARGASRYCMRDAGLRGAMLRSHTVWKQRQDNGALHWRFVEKRAVLEVGGQVCYVVERTCPSPEVDPFEIGGAPNIRDRDNPADVGSVRVTLFIDAEKWLQVGSQLHRQDGHLLASYYFRDINLNPTFADDTFTTDGLKKAVAEVKKQ